MPYANDYYNMHDALLDIRRNLAKATNATSWEACEANVQIALDLANKQLNTKAAKELQNESRNNKAS